MAVETNYGIVPGDIKPSGLVQHREVDLMGQLMRSLQGICQKLDDDAGVPLTTYEANVITAILNMAILDGKNNYIHNFVREEGWLKIEPTGLTDKARQAFLYQFLDMLETLTEQLDADVLTDSNYEALCYTATMTGYQVENEKGSIIGNSTDYTFRSGGSGDQRQLVEFYYDAVNSIETLTEKLDADGTVTDTNYEALWFTAVILTRVENGARSVVGNASTDRG